VTDEPTKVVLMESFSHGSRRLARGTRIWCLSRQPGGESLVEHDGQRFRVPSEILLESPVPPPMEKLEALDPCFRADRDAFEEVHDDPDRLFRVLECVHGNLFLEHTVPAILWYERLIFMGDVPREEAAYVEFWERHRGLTTDELHLRAIGL